MVLPSEKHAFAKNTLLRNALLRNALLHVRVCGGSSRILATFWMTSDRAFYLKETAFCLKETAFYLKETDALLRKRALRKPPQGGRAQVQPPQKSFSDPRGWVADDTARHVFPPSVPRATARKQRRARKLFFTIKGISPFAPKLCPLIRVMEFDNLSSTFVNF